MIVFFCCNSSARSEKLFSVFLSFFLPFFFPFVRSSLYGLFSIFFFSIGYFFSCPTHTLIQCVTLTLFGVLESSPLQRLLLCDFAARSGHDFRGLTFCTSSFQLENLSRLIFWFQMTVLIFSCTSSALPVGSARYFNRPASQLCEVTLASRWTTRQSKMKSLNVASVIPKP